MTHSMNDEAVYKTAPATLGLVNIGLCQVPILRKTRKTSRNSNCPQKCPFYGHFGGFFYFLCKVFFCKDLWFFALHSVPQDASFDLSKSTLRNNFIFFTIRGDPLD